MQRHIKLLLLSVLLCFLPSASIAQKSGRTTRRPTPPPVICKIESVPKGVVVVGYKRNPACRDGFELLVKRPENGDIICAESPVPPRFSLGPEAQGDSVGTCPNRAFLIIGSANRASTDDALGRAFANQTSDIQVEGEGTVIRLLADDNDGARHQQFILELASGQTLLISHNIDIAPRVAGLAIGDHVVFYGEYVWNAKGGLIHWTHHDPRGKHVAGWVRHLGKTYK